MPSVPPLLMRSQSSSLNGSDMDQDVLFAVRRQLAMKELELAKVKQQLANLVNESWRKNLQVAQLKKEMDVQRLQNGVVAEKNVNKSGVNDDNALLIVRKSDFECLNVDLVRRIAMWLSLSDLSSLSRTSKQMRSAVWEDESGWQMRAAAILMANCSSGEEFKTVLFERARCSVCKAELAKGGVKQMLDVRLCLKSECFKEAFVGFDEGNQEFALSADDVKGLPCFVDERHVCMYKRNDVKNLAFAKYGGSEGITNRLRLIQKQKRLLSLSRFGHVTSRVKTEDLEFSEAFL